MPHVWDLFGVKNEEDIGVDIITPIAGDVSLEWAQRALNLHTPDGKSTRVHFHRGDTADVAREYLLGKAMQTNSDWIFYLDSDVIPPENVLETLMGHDLPIVSGIYNSKTPDIPWSMWRYEWAYNEKEIVVPVRYWEERLIEVDTVGFGCILIKKDVIRDMWKKSDLPLFFLSTNRSTRLLDKLTVPSPRMLACSEDFWFCLLAKACGYKIMVDTEVKCSHMGRFKLTNGMIGTDVI